MTVMAQVDDRRRDHDRVGPDRAAARPASATRCSAALLVAAAAVLRCSWRRGCWRGHDWVHRVRQLSKQRHWALDLRLSLLILFVLAWIAQKGGTSILIAGFGAGVTVALLGGPKRLSTQMRGVAEGFFVPLYFVVLGAQPGPRRPVREPVDARAGGGAGRR